MGITPAGRPRPNEFEDGFSEEIFETLHQRVSRIRARWLKRVMYSREPSSTEKCLAYAVFDHLNCVTLDCWPSQRRLAELLGFDSVKTIQRAALGLEDRALLVIRQVGRSSYRYAPTFLPTDGDPEDSFVINRGHSCLGGMDKTVNESFLLNHLTPPTPTAAETAKERSFGLRTTNSLKQRGAYELGVAEMLGPDGMEMLARLAELDDAHVERLCRAYAIGALDDRDLAAARLAAQQAR
jgi:hypothetical protein